mmetsp:Transcript_123503/g.357109  ORF Transcript_123503/g.357109 Transcript_123503/m.357109 type:complete len:238 (+) Transcript_123503:248-961(+)
MLAALTCVMAPAIEGGVLRGDCAIEIGPNRGMQGTSCFSTPCNKAAECATGSCLATNSCGFCEGPSGGVRGMRQLKDAGEQGTALQPEGPWPSALVHGCWGCQRSTRLLAHKEAAAALPGLLARMALAVVGEAMRSPLRDRPIAGARPRAGDPGASLSATWRSTTKRSSAGRPSPPSPALACKATSEQEAEASMEGSVGEAFASEVAGTAAASERRARTDFRGWSQPARTLAGCRRV